MKASDLIERLRRLPADADVDVEVVPGQTVGICLGGSTIRPAYVSSDNENRGSIMIRRKDGDAVILAQDGVAICRVVMAKKSGGVRFFAPRSIEIVREEVASTRGVKHANGIF